MTRSIARTCIALFALHMLSLGSWAHTMHMLTSFRTSRPP